MGTVVLGGLLEDRRYPPPQPADVAVPNIQDTSCNRLHAYTPPFRKVAYSGRAATAMERARISGRQPAGKMPNIDMIVW